MNTVINHSPRRCEASLRNRPLYYALWHSLLLLILLITMPARTFADNITFADAVVKRICVENWDTNGDGELSEEEAAAVTDLGQVFKSSKITTFKELQYFTGLKSIGNSAFSSCSGLTDIAIPNSISAIGSYAFSGCRGLTEVTIPNSVTSIGSYAFDGCTGLTAVHISDLAAWCMIEIEGWYSNPLDYAHHLYLNGSEIKELVIPNSVTAIGDNAFHGCRGLTEVTIPNNVMSIGSNAFSGCSGLTAVHISDLAAWCKIEFKDYSSNPLDYAHHLFLNGSEIKELVIPNSVTAIGDYAFEGCRDLTEVTIPSNVMSIGRNAFSGCSGLTAVHISDLAAWCKIELKGYSSNPLDYAHHLFLNGSEIKELIIPNSVTAIGDYAFEGCSDLTEVTIPSNVMSIGSNAFSGCSGLTAVHISDLAAWCKIEFEGSSSNPLYYAHHLFLNGSEIKELVIPNSVTAIGDNAFYGCSGLTEVTIPSNVTSIGGSAFCNCSELIVVHIPNSVTSIGYHAFDGCSGLTAVDISDLAAWCKIEFKGISSNPLFYANHLYLNGLEIKELVIPNSITAIGDYAFCDCSGLTEVTIPNSVTSIGSYAFCDCSGLTEVTIPNSVTSIGSSAFLYCSGLRSVSIPNSVTSIGRDAFAATLWYKIQPSGLIYAGKVVYEYKGTMPNNTHIIIKEGTLSIAEYAFYDCDGMTAVTIPNSVTSIGSSAFYDCSGLKAVYISDLAAWCKIEFKGYSSNPLYYAHHLYLNDSEIKELVIPNSVMSIGNDAFQYCSSLTSVNIPNSVTSIGDHAFSGCSSLTAVASEILEPFAIGNNVFGKAINTATLTVPFGTKEKYMSTDGWKNFKNIEEYILFSDQEVKRVCVENWDTNKDRVLSFPEAADVTDLRLVFQELPIKNFEELKCFTGLTGLRNYAFYHCKELTSLALPDNITSIGDGAFWDCSSLSSITIPYYVSTIGKYAFSGCSSLTSITIPCNVSTIGKYAFFDCPTLITIKSEVETPFAIEKDVFGNETYAGSLLVPYGKINAYKSTDGWNLFQNIDDGSTIELRQEEIEINAGETFTLEVTIVPEEVASSAVWNSSDESVAIVSEEGIVTGLAAGTADITVTISNGKTATCHVTVKNNMQIESISLNLTETTIKVGETATLTATLTPSDAEDQTVAWTSDNETVASVTGDGLTATITGNGIGTATITATTGNGLTATCYVTVQDDDEKAWTDDETAVTYHYNTKSLTAKVVSADNNLTTGQVAICERFTVAENTYTVNEVQAGAFAKAQDVVSVSVPSSVTTVGEKAFGNGHLQSLVWLPATKLPADALPEEGERSRNFLIYVNNGDIVPRAVANTCHVAVLGNDGTYRATKAVVLADGEDFCCPLPFRADVSYTHCYQMATGLNSCEGWETLSLPFDVETVSHADGRMLLPFGNALSGGERPFWLYALTPEGFVKTRQVRANTPYIVSMPNNESYLPDYRLAGAVTFAATDAEVQPTETAEGTTLEGKGTFRAVYRTLRSSETVACLNSVNDQHTATGGETPGSHFMTDLRATAPFEAVFMNASAGVRSFAIAFARQDTDAIGDLTLLQGCARKGIYNLQGQRMSQAPRFSDHAPLRKGVYVVGGKKVVVK